MSEQAQPIVVDSEYFTDEVLDKPDVTYVGKPKTLLEVIGEKIDAQNKKKKPG